MRVIIEREGDRFGVMLDTGGGGLWGIGTDFARWMYAKAVAVAIVDAKVAEGVDCRLVDTTA